MSYIDTLQHEICGVLAGLPLYRLLVTDTTELRAGPDHLLLGGGSGEHPAARFHMLSALYRFLLSEELEDERFFGLDRIETLRCALDPYTRSLPDSDFSHWRGDDWARIIAHAQQEQGFGRPYSPEKDGSIEHWITTSIGEYVLVARTDLAVALLPESVSDEIRTLATRVSESPPYLNVRSFPTGYEHVAGRRNALCDGNVRH